MSNHLKSKKYLAWVREQPCCHTGLPAEPHHVIAIGMGKTGGKAADIHAVPLCRETHDEVHDDPDSWPQAKWLMETQERAFRDGILVVA